ncbi:MAG TPA: hypothetical protein PKB02_08205 [Anaerohalosphaeraceae bacterium]|nr:hypothetical protein [Anaerohalosphaeraceae bacterium]
MTEIDFIPQWYRAGRKRKLWYHRQYLIFSAMAAVIALGCFVAGHSLATARAELTTMRDNLSTGIQTIQRFRQLQLRWDNLNQKASMLHSVTPRTPFASVLAELSACVGPNVVLNKLSIQNVPIESKEKNTAAAGPMIRLGAAENAKGNSAQAIPAQTEVVLQGIAADGSVVAGLIASLEESDYFRQVIPGYSKNIKIRECSATEFEIRCVLADYEIVK